jgi:hypothetical protein
LNQQGSNIVGQLIIWLIIGAVLGAILIIAARTFWGLYTLFGGYSFCLFPPAWLLPLIFSPLYEIKWIPLGALIGAIVALCWLHKRRIIPANIFRVVGGVLILVLLIALVIQVISARYGDQAVIDTRYTEFHESYRRKEYETAYSFMSPEYRHRHTIEEFKRDFDFLRGGLGYPLETNHAIRFFGNKAYLLPQNEWRIFFGSELQLELEEIEGIWYFTGENERYYD